MKFFEIIPKSDGSVTILFNTDPPRILSGIVPDTDQIEDLEDDLMRRYDDYLDEAEVIKWPF